ncbi:MAG TPA: response regulator [Flavobacterium sp.]|uniref:response regulator n=1 Tax=Flavobacterium sp. TaxID=239 RepID=UPI002D083540|nr:response regulator [Flavobacterium sp.]HSD14803.1 response regulator [Flavobacterium sp.]
MKNIMLIDDNDIDNFISNHIVAKSGVADKVSLMSSAIDALKHLEEVKEDFEEFPDLIFLDISMPVMDGFGFLNEVTKFPKVSERRCFIVMLTSSNNKNDIERAKQYSVVKDYFVKPLRAEMINLLMNRRMH